MATYFDLSKRSFNMPQSIVDEGGYPYQFFGEQEPIIHFAHANGYAPLVYMQLFEALQSRVSIQAPMMRPLWQDYRRFTANDWWPFVDDLTGYFDKHEAEPAFAVGHSIGATLLLIMALKEPQRFSKLVLIDPAIFPRHIFWAYKLLKMLHLHRVFHPLINKTLKRKRSFSSEEELFHRFRHKPIFKQFSDQAIINYMQGSFIHDNDRYHLLFPPEWEAMIYETGILMDAWIWKQLPTLKVPVSLIRGEHSDLCTQELESRFKQSSPLIEVTTILNAGHLVPLEEAQDVADCILSFYDRKDASDDV